MYKRQKKIKFYTDIFLWYKNILKRGGFINKKKHIIASKNFITSFGNLKIEHYQILILLKANLWIFI